MASRRIYTSSKSLSVTCYAPHSILGTEKIINKTKTSKQVPVLMELSCYRQITNIFQIVVSVKKKKSKIIGRVKKIALTNA